MVPKKMRELEKIRETLEVCLEEEKQAKKDEEIVRQLQGLFWILVQKKRQTAQKDLAEFRSEKTDGFGIL